jgi:hypothetical protein
MDSDLPGNAKPTDNASVFLDGKEQIAPKK